MSDAPGPADPLKGPGPANPLEGPGPADPLEGPGPADPLEGPGPAGPLFAPLASTAAMRRAVSGSAWVQAMLRVEAALAAVQGELGLIPGEAAELIGQTCATLAPDPAALGRAAVAAGNPAVPLVAALTAAVPAQARGFVHWGATSQDILDSAAALVSRDAVALLLGDLDAVAASCARLAGRHRGSVMAGRTLLQQALPTTFGLKAAGWLVAVVDARVQLAATAARTLSVQLGGAAGTLASLGPAGVEVAEALAGRLGLAAPVLPWHTARGRVVELASSVALATGALAKIACDVVLLAQHEVGEVAELVAPGRGGSSTLPHKRNPVAAVAVLACARRLVGQVPVLLAGMVAEHERAVGGWQAEWATCDDVFLLASGACARAREMLDGLRVDARRMRANLDATLGLPMAEHVMMALAPAVGRGVAHDIVAAACARAQAAGRSLRAELGEDPRVGAHLGPGELDAALDPTAYLGSADRFVDRALRHYRARKRHWARPPAGQS